MSSIIRPPYDAELGVPADNPPTTMEILQAERREIATTYTPESILGPWPEISHKEVQIDGPLGIITLAILEPKQHTVVATAAVLEGKRGEDLQLRRPGILFLHGGGMVMGSRLFGLEPFLPCITQFSAVLVSVEYRLAPEHPDPAPVEDCYAALVWTSAHAAELGIDVDRIIVAGQSAGGGLAAGTALLARDRGGPKLRSQCLVYPMLDDRMQTVSSKQYMHEGGNLSGETTIVSWNWLLEGKQGAKEGEVSIYAAPARATDLTGLPEAWIDVGSAELFRDESVAYATKLWECGVQCELHVWPGAWHAFDVVSPEAEISKSCHAARLHWLKRVLRDAKAVKETTAAP